MASSLFIFQFLKTRKRENQQFHFSEFCFQKLENLKTSRASPNKLKLAERGPFGPARFSCWPGIPLTNTGWQSACPSGPHVSRAGPEPWGGGWGGGGGL